ncbi:Hormone-sensitive lipase [Termitomyces sp. J132]|nr:hypothetical protein H2248_004717 [Termitomyces sp. 'cryptogamus']KNZ72912.1 Hormone-sensitive lipase [Termitomyces sp. J132]
MIDHLVGRPNPSWKRTQVFLVIFFWLWRIIRGNSRPPRIAWLRSANRILQRYTPWQIIVSTLTALYAVRNFDNILGLGSPEPLARLYSPSYYRATWIVTGLDAGFATAMSIRPKWLRDICSILFSVYYIVYANEGDEKLRRFRAVPTVEMLRTTWEKTTNPYIRMITHLPWLSMRRKILLSRPKTSKYTRPITAYLFFYPPESQLRHATDLILDFPGGGFVAMSPEHHEERLRMWAVKTGKPVLSIDYGKAPEYPYPFAIDEAFDTYKILSESAGRVIGMSGEKFNVIISGDSAGATLAVNVILRILENESHSQTHDEAKLRHPVALVLNYAALDINFTSWMSPSNLRVLQSEQSVGNLPGISELAAQKDHLQHISPLSMVKDNKFSHHKTRRIRRTGSWRDAFRSLTSTDGKRSQASGKHSLSVLKTSTKRMTASFDTEPSQADGEGDLADVESEDEDEGLVREEDQPIRARVRYEYPQVPSPPYIGMTHTELERQQEELSAAVEAANTEALQVFGRKDRAEPIGTRLTMTSRTGYFQDRIVSPSMMRAMAILYIGPHHNPDFATDYHISPILAPAHLLAQFPPLLLQCGEKDPFVDDTVIFAGRVREAKRARKHELQLAISGKSARFGSDGHKGSSINNSSLDTKTLAMMKKERDKLAKETEDDWVQLVLFSEWSHGYLQMPTLMSEAKAVIEELAEWIDGAFVKNAEKFNNRDKDLALLDPPASSETETDETITFIPRKYQSESFPVNEPRDKSIAANGGQSTAGHQEESSDESDMHQGDCAASLTRDERDHSIVNETHTPGSRSTPHPPDTPRSRQRALAGTQISETELMRRRRLLDSHIFEQ